jgi:hypothetical protein
MKPYKFLDAIYKTFFEMFIVPTSMRDYEVQLMRIATTLFNDQIKWLSLLLIILSNLFPTTPEKKKKKRSGK